MDFFKQSAKGEPELGDLIVKAIRQSDEKSMEAHRQSMKAIERMTDKFNKRIAAIEKELEIRAPVEPKGPADDTEIAPGLQEND